MPLKPNLADRLGGRKKQGSGEEKATQKEDMSAKVSRLATTTSISAFIATGCLVFAFVTHSQAASALASAKADLKTVVVAAEQIPCGATISEEMLTTADVPGHCLGEDTATQVEDVIGKQAIVRIDENCPLRGAEPNQTDTSSSLASKISKGKKAVSINVTTESDFAQSLLHQGDRVTLYSFENGVKSRICKDVEVLALDGYTNYADLSQDGVSASYSTVTVEVTRSTAEKIRELQSGKETIWMVLTATADLNR